MRKWIKILLVINLLAILGFIGSLIFVSIIGSAMYQRHESGGEFLPLVVAIVFVQVFGVLAVVNCVSFFMFLIKNWRPGVLRGLSIATLLASVGYLALFGTAILQMYPQLNFTRSQRQLPQRASWQELHHPIYITVAEATTLLNECKLDGFYYTDNGHQLLADATPEGTPTGIVLAYKEQPHRLHIADNMITTMLPIAQNAKKFCPHLRFWHDGKFER